MIVDFLFGEILDYVDAIKTKFKPFPKTFGKERVQRLKIGDKIDHQDQAGRFLKAKIVGETEERFQIHYFGWDSKWDEWCHKRIHAHRFADYGSISERKGHELDPAHFPMQSTIDIRPLNSTDWIDATIVKHHRNKITQEIVSGQIQVSYRVPQKTRRQRRWLHVDDYFHVRHPVWHPYTTDLRRQSTICHFLYRKKVGKNWNKCFH